jgi:hypothetical protein
MTREQILLKRIRFLTWFFIIGILPLWACYRWAGELESLD